MPQNAQPLLQVSGLAKSYEGKRGAQEQHHALSGVDFTLQIPAPRCMTIFSPLENTGHGIVTISIFSDVLSA